jgi:uncharacterized membrane protein HdeD (DUF308 family)
VKKKHHNFLFIFQGIMVLFYFVIAIVFFFFPIQSSSLSTNYQKIFAFFALFYGIMRAVNLNRKWQEAKMSAHEDN